MIVRVLAMCVLGSLALAGAAKEVTFHKDVEPILQNRCQGCHRPGEAGRMPLLTYQQARPWAKAIREVVASKRMPPWYADPHYGKFENDRSLTPAEVDTLLAWSDGGAKRGNPKDAPKPRQFSDGWAIPKPDVVFEMPQDFVVPAKGTIEYHYVILPTNFTEDKWVEAFEARPGNREVVHHIIAFVREPNSRWMRDAKPGVPFVPERGRRSREGANNENPENSGVPNAELLAGYAPGLPEGILRPGQAKLVKAGSDIVLQMHYTANGKESTDRSRVGLVFAKQPPQERVLTLAAANSKFAIPPGDANYRVDSEFTLHDEAKLVDLMPHMHLRGKDFEYRLVYPDGRKETILRVPNYDFNWQLFYYLSEQKTLPKGTKIECTAHFDNSAANKANPDPSKEVKWGDQSWEEMMIGWFDLAIPAGKNPRDLFPPRKPQPRSSGE
jgi:hypothetical protein